MLHLDAREGGSGWKIGVPERDRLGSLRRSGRDKQGKEKNRQENRQHRFRFHEHLPWKRIGKPSASSGGKVVPSYPNQPGTGNPDFTARSARR
jgi:hypothetical protein